ncbi:hypothetical protein DET54_102510 [Paenibacillus pabuli]|uniref:Uncharacterized protein n=1 Tax=Paenibacillus pabuli TaxID=1472 RepID=A0A855XU07_9BACL|nr:hypothetical protein DET56_106213 [Paenibacillus pabuli]PXW06707.1 hypothetical protein DEU73_106221 [Paenibacillus taichungensis]RAJ01023.1 hypothetical protein DET54_102510 [Paenibacillus pabuli]
MACLIINNTLLNGFVNFYKPIEIAEEPLLVEEEAVLFLTMTVRFLFTTGGKRRGSRESDLFFLFLIMYNDVK